LCGKQLLDLDKFLVSNLKILKIFDFICILYMNI